MNLAAKLNKFFVMVPHVDDEDLDMPEYRLLGHIRRRAGEGVCYASVASMATKTRMSERLVRRTLQRLERLGRITITIEPGGSYQIRPVGIMAENIKRLTPGESATPLRKRHPLAKTPSPSESATTPLAQAPP